MTTIQVSDFRQNLSEMGNKTAYAGERFCVQRNGKPLFAVVPLDDMVLLEHLEDQMDLELAAKALKKGKFINLESLTKELNL